MRRRTLYVIIIVAIVVIIGVVVLFLLKNGAGQTTAPSGTTGSLPSVNNNSGFGAGGSGNNGASGNAGNAGGSSGTAGTVGIISPGTSAGGSAANGVQSFGLISNEPVIAYSVDKANNVTIIEPNGLIASILNGQPTFLSSITVQDVSNAGFSYDGKYAFVSFGNPSNPQLSVFDVTNKSWTALPAGMMSPVWSPSSDQLAYMMSNASGGETLYTINAAGTKVKPTTLTSFHLQDTALSWPSANQIVIASKPSSYETGSVFIFNISNKTFAQPLDPAAGLETIWSSGVDPYALVFVANAAQRDGTLSLWSTASDTMQQLNFLTMPSKCVFGNATSSSPVAAASSTARTATSTITSFTAFYCGIPQDPTVFSGQPLPDEYNQKAVFTVDSIYRIRTDTGTMAQLLVPPISVDASDLHVFNNVLFFINRYDQKLYALLLGN